MSKPRPVAATGKRNKQLGRPTVSTETELDSLAEPPSPAEVAAWDAWWRSIAPAGWESLLTANPVGDDVDAVAAQGGISNAETG